MDRDTQMCVRVQLFNWNLPSLLERTGQFQQIAQIRKNITTIVIQIVGTNAMI